MNESLLSPAPRAQAADPQTVESDNHQTTGTVDTASSSGQTAPPSSPDKQPLGGMFVRFAVGLGFSEFANLMVMFAVPLYVLRVTGNPAAMGTSLALAMIPFVVLQPVGGMIADRYSKRRILAGMNLALAVVVLGYSLAYGTFDIVSTALVAMFLMYAVEGFGSAASEAAVPALVPEGALVRANSVTYILSMVAAIGAPLLAGALLPSWGLTAVLVVSAALFLAAAILNRATKIPYTHRPMTQSIARTAARDIGDGVRFLTRDNRTIGRIVLVVALGSTTMTSLILVGLPVLATKHFGLSESATGLIVSLAMGGGALGAAAMGALENRVTIDNAWRVVFATAIVLTLGATVFWWGTGSGALIVIAVTMFLVMAANSGLEVLWWSFLGSNTPEALVGKVMAAAMAVMVAGVAAGNYLNGLLFARFGHVPGIALLIIAVAIVVVALVARIRGVENALTIESKGELG